MSDSLGRAVAMFLERAEASAASSTLASFISNISSGYSAPNHLAPFIAELDRALAGQPVRCVIHAPPRHGKSESALHAIVLGLRRNPRLTFAYATYGADLSYSKSRVARELARKAGVELAGDAAAVKEWRTKQGGGLLATGVGGPLTGHGVSGCLIVDDPFKNRVEAESAARRQQVLDWWTSVAFTRLEPGASAFVLATRWHPEDLSGHLIKQGWKYIRLPAIDDNGAALWPERYDVEALAEIRRNAGEYTWASLYQGLPRPRGGSLFKDTFATYSLAALEEILRSRSGYRKGIGVDLAYSKKTSADYSAAVVGLQTVVNGRKLIHVIEVLRRQEEARTFAALGQRLQTKHGGASALWYAAGAEHGVANLISSLGFRVIAKPATADKFIRAQPYAATWNDGRVLLPDDPSSEPWVSTFLTEHLNFTGLDGETDDQVDAGAAMHDLLNGIALPQTTPVHRSFPNGGGWQA